MNFKDVAHKTVAELFDMLKAKEAAIQEMDEVIKLQDADLRKYEKQIENLKEQLNNMEWCYIGKKKEVEELQKRIEVASSRIRGICRYINEDNPRCVDALAVTVDCELIRIEGYLRGAND